MASMQITVRQLKRFVREAAVASKRPSADRTKRSLEQLKAVLPDLCSAINDLESMSYWEATDWADDEFEGDPDSFDKLCDEADAACDAGDIVEAARIAQRFTAPAEAVLDIARGIEADARRLKNYGRNGMRAAQAVAKLASSSAESVSEKSLEDALR